LKTIDEEGIDEAVKRYHRLKKAFRKIYYVDVGEREINTLGYILLRGHRVKEAIEILKLNVAEYPESWNVYDSLAEAYMKNGDKDPAIKYYKKSLQLNPKNENGKKMLEELSK
jgi:tetratricopeptide (TPR) repeat protein